MQAPDFRLRDQNGNTVTLEQFRGKKIILFFYPKAETPGCTVEACSFRDNIRAFGQLNTVVLGISPDDPEDLKSFEQNHDLNFTLLSDPAHETAEQYGVWKEKSFMGRRFMGVVRTTFLIDEQGNITKRFDNVNPVSHTAEVLAGLGAKPGKPVTKTGQRPVTAKKAAAKKKIAKKTAKKAATKRPARKAAKTSRSSKKRPTKKTARKATMRGRR
jgi:thioredoxin-dependent peroxiredoxin